MALHLRDLTEPDELLTRAQVAAMLGVSPSTVTRWADEGKLTCARTLGGHRRYLRREITDIMHLVQSEIEARDDAFEEARMQALHVEIPRLYGDHHTLAVHQALAQLSGIDDVWASPSTHALHVEYDPQQIQADAIVKRLARAGYPVRNGDTEAANHRKDPGWSKLNLRMTQTYRSDA